ncbi:Hpt domain-containing protein [Kordiimonas sp. SCSIO 12610]|uniref:Hpt domain-containing protein n=1 Tax=Kordiimonas sp. SCSIO 12610 TaxID=2829597 RepID=UPI00210C3CC3|nr:Hpt domain-containing protein [Kordiimonas sp. SCSIO 12610]UTW55370.1 Hpt domain-containing protein [Kordiimonas sp. SCSIO 12610]
MEDLSLCNMKVLQTLENEVGRDVLPILVSSLCDEISASLTNFDKYFETQNWQMLEIESHALKSATLSFGAENLSQRCREIEFAIKENQPQPHIHSLIKNFNMQAKNTLDHFEKMIA